MATSASQHLNRIDVLRFADATALAQAAARESVALLRSELRVTNYQSNSKLETRSSKLPFSVALSGGRVAKPFFEAVVREVQAARSRELEFAVAGSPNSRSGLHFFWSDERCVPPDDPESNFGLARRLLLEPLAVPEANIHRIRGELPPERAAAEADAELRRVVPANNGGQPALDLVFLGLGEDGHVAALFPNEAEMLTADAAAYRAILHAPKPPPRRITLGYGPLSTARRVWVLASGPGKTEALRESLAESGRTPLARVIQSRALTRIFTEIAGEF